MKTCLAKVFVRRHRSIPSCAVAYARSREHASAPARSSGNDVTRRRGALTLHQTRHSSCGTRRTTPWHRLTARRRCRALASAYHGSRVLVRLPTLSRRESTSGSPGRGATSLCRVGAQGMDALCVGRCGRPGRGFLAITRPAARQHAHHRC